MRTVSSPSWSEIEWETTAEWIAIATIAIKPAHSIFGAQELSRHEQHFFRLTQIARPIKFPRTMRSPITRSRRNNHVSRFAVKTSPVMMILKGDRDKAN